MENITDTVKNKCLAFLSEALKLAADSSGSADPPYSLIERTCLAGNLPQKLSYRILDTVSIWNHIKPLLGQPFEEAKNSLQDYIDSKDIKPAGVWLHDVEEHFLLPLIDVYLEQAKAFIYYPIMASKVVNAMFETLDLTMVDWVGLMALEGVHITVPSLIEKRQLSIRPIEDHDIFLLDRTTRLPLFIGMRFRLPQRDWRICEIRTQGLRGRGDGWNKIVETTEILPLALRAFRSGSFKAELVSIDIASSFGKMSGEFLGGGVHNVKGTKPYEILNDEIPEFRKFWRKFRCVMTNQQHYLLMPLRRLMFGAERVRLDDELIDYVVGLEALLSKKDDQHTEIRYRFGVRGCVVLASKKAERKKYFKEMQAIYDMRSKIIHGAIVSHEQLDRHVALAESALRKVWNWYFKLWYSQSNNKAAIEWIDNKLIR